MSVNLPAVNFLKVRFDAKIRADLSNPQILYWRLIELGHVRQGHASFACNLWRVEKNQFVDEARRQRRAVERRPCLEKDAENFAPAQLGEHGREIDAATTRAHANKFDAGTLQLTRFG